MKEGEKTIHHLFNFSFLPFFLFLIKVFIKRKIKIFIMTRVRIFKMRLKTTPNKYNMQKYNIKYNVIIFKGWIKFLFKYLFFSYRYCYIFFMEKSISIYYGEDFED